MVRFKNRHILVEFVQPALFQPSFSSQAPIPSFAQPPTNDEDDDSDVDLDEDDELPQIPDVPFLLPLPSVNGADSRVRLGDDGGSAVFKSVRGIVQDVYGDEGWGRIASSFKVIYHSPLTTLTIIRVARPHYRLVWSALTLLSSINGQHVVPRVVAVSGTIKKLQNAAIVYHRNTTARVLAVALDGKASAAEKEEETKRLDTAWAKERDQITALQD